jgi:tetratricopeptide (TPR) repeat protein
MIAGRATLAAAAVMVLLLVSPTCMARDWIAYSSDNFTLYSSAREDQTLALLESFEIFRVTALATLNLPDEPENQRLIIILYGQGRDYNRIRPSSRVAGFFYDALSGPRMIVGTQGRDVGWRYVLFHEYVHYLMNQRSTLNYPRWYAEGLATLLESTEITDTSIRVGAPPGNAWRAISLGLNTTVQEVVAMRGRTDSGFYLTSWLMAHYFSFGDATRRAQTAEYLRRYAAGEDSVDAFTEAYGMTPSGMNREVSRYGQRQTIGGLEWPRIRYTGTLSTRTLDPVEANLLLATIAMEIGRRDTMRHYLSEASKLDAGSPYRARRLSTEAIVQIHEQRVDEGDERIARVLELDTDDPAVIGDIAHYAFDRFVEIRCNGAEGSAESELARAIEYGRRAVEADRGNLEALYYLGLSYEANGALQSSVDTLLDAYDISPTAAPVIINLTRVLIKGNQLELAEYLISRLYSATHSDERREVYREILAEIETGAVDVSRFDLLARCWEQLESARK